MRAAALRHSSRDAAGARHSIGVRFGGQNIALLATYLGLILRACHGTEGNRRSGPNAAAKLRGVAPEPWHSTSFRSQSRNMSPKMAYFVRPCSLPQNPFCAPCKGRPMGRWRVAVRVLKSLIWRVLSAMMGSAASGDCEFSPCCSPNDREFPMTPGTPASFSPHLPQGSSRRDLGGATAAHTVRRGLTRPDRERSGR